jgi:starvation-inducible DNA-binding protein
VKFEELYSDLLLKIDEIAERILTLGYSPNHNYSDYKKSSSIMESSKISVGFQAVEGVLRSFQTIISLQRQLLLLSQDAGDEGTNSLISDYVMTQEKLVWMYSAFLKK